MIVHKDPVSFKQYLIYLLVFAIPFSNVAITRDFSIIKFIFILLVFLGLSLLLFAIMLLTYRTIILSKNYSVTFLLFIAPIFLFLFSQGLDKSFAIYFIIVIILKLYKFHIMQTRN